MVDATGLAVAPGFINMLSHSYLSLIEDPRSMSELVQGVTTQLMGEGWSMGPVPPDGAPELTQHFGGELPWQTLREYLLYVEAQGHRRRTSHRSSAPRRCASTAPGTTTGR